MLATTGGLTLVGLLGRTVEHASALSGQDYGDRLTDVDNVDGTAPDRWGNSEVTVEVGVDGNGGTVSFAPPAAREDPGM